MRCCANSRIIGILTYHIGPEQLTAADQAIKEEAWAAAHDYR